MDKNITETQLFLQDDIDTLTVLETIQKSLLGWVEAF